jgi:hypothetical protein
MKTKGQEIAGWLHNELTRPWGGSAKVLWSADLARRINAELTQRTAECARAVRLAYRRDIMAYNEGEAMNRSDQVTLEIIEAAVFAVDKPAKCTLCGQEIKKEDITTQTGDLAAARSSRVVMPFRIFGGGIHKKAQPRYKTAKEAHDDLKRYAESVDRSWLVFSVIEDLPDGAWKLVAPLDVDSGKIK